MTAITLNQLESHLWESANILPGSVDAADFKTYIFRCYSSNASAMSGTNGKPMAARSGDRWTRWWKR